MFYGQADHHPDGSFIATEWITAAFIPLIPLRSFRLIRPKPSEDPFETFRNAFTYGYDHFEVLDELPIFWPQVLRIYVCLVGAGSWYAAAIWLFFFRIDLFQLYFAHPIKAILLLFPLLAASAVPVVLVRAARKRSLSAAGAAPRSSGFDSDAGPMQEAPPPIKRGETLITHCHMCKYSIPPEQRSYKTCPNCGADLTRKRF